MFAHFTAETLPVAAEDARKLYRFARFTQGMSAADSTSRIASLYGITREDAGRLVGIGVANREGRGN